MAVLMFSRSWAWVKHHQGTIAFLTLAVGLVFSLVSISHTSSKADRVSQANSRVIGQVQDIVRRLDAEITARTNATCESLHDGRKAILSTVKKILDLNPDTPLETKRRVIQATIDALSGKPGERCGALTPEDIPKFGS